MTTLTGVGMVAAASGQAIGGAVHRPLPLIVLFTVINAFAALAAVGGAATRRVSGRPR
jgi:hypothetical protein